MKKININIGILSQLPGLKHIYCTDRQHRLISANRVQLEITKKLLGVTHVDDVFGKTLFEIYQNNQKRALELHAENELVLSSAKVLRSHSTLIIPGEFSIELNTTKFPCFNAKGKIVAVAGISYYVRKTNLNLVDYYKLTSREMDCLNYLLMHKTAKEIASTLRLSPRTVEGYLEEIKNKLNCPTKAILLDTLKKINLITHYC